MDRPRPKPSIFKVGVVEERGDEVHVRGWGVGFCMTRCGCHRHPHNGQLYLRTGRDGSLGLCSYRIGGCGCCEPWEPDELVAILRDLADLEELAAS